MATRGTLAVLAGVLLVLAACTGAEDGTDGDEPTDACVGVADRWATLQQGYLDRLGDADLDELAVGSERLTAAAAWFGSAMIEQARDAEAVGCADRFVAASPLLCARVERLRPLGEVAEQVVAGLVSGCTQE